MKYPLHHSEEDKETLATELRSLKACHDLPMQEKARQDQELQVVHEDNEESGGGRVDKLGGA